MTAKLEYAGLEGHPRAGGGGLEDERDRAAGERARGERLGLEDRRPIEQLIQLSGAELCSGEEVARQAQQCTFPVSVRLRVLSWTLGPGNARWQELAAALAGWEWDVALLRHLPSRWALPVATALDSEFRCTPPSAGRDSLLRRLLSASPQSAERSGSDAVLARRDRVVAEWPVDRRRPTRAGIHAARLACGLWMGNLPDQDLDTDDVRALLTQARGDAVALAGPSRAGSDERDGMTDLDEVAQGGGDRLWATRDLVPVSATEVLAGGAVRGHPPLAITLERRF
jgi:hypothetical protein